MVTVRSGLVTTCSNAGCATVCCTPVMGCTTEMGCTAETDCKASGYWLPSRTTGCVRVREGWYTRPCKEKYINIQREPENWNRKTTL